MEYKIFASQGWSPGKELLVVVLLDLNKPGIASLPNQRIGPQKDCLQQEKREIGKRQQGRRMMRIRRWMNLAECADRIAVAGVHPIQARW